MTARVSVLAFLILAGYPNIHSGAAEPDARSKRTYTAREIVEHIKVHIGVPWRDKTYDVWKAGDPDARVTGIATTHLATLDVLKKAQTRGANFIISHETIFYRHSDHGTADIENDPVFREKQSFIKEHNMVVWRFHDHWHLRRPDGIAEGMIDKIGWRRHLRKGEQVVFDLPPTDLRSLAEQLEIIFQTTAIRVIGDPTMRCSKIGLLPGMPSSIKQIRMLQRDNVEVLIAGESREWETVEYARDAAASGRRKALILLGHATSEEAGMKNCAVWLSKMLPDVSVTFVPAGDPFWSP